MSEIRVRGHYLVAVSGYKLRQSRTFHVFSTDEGHISVPDRLLPAPLHEPDSMQWWETIWVVGDNPRERLCKLDRGKPYLRFARFDDARGYAAARQKRFPRQEHQVVLVIQDEFDKPTMRLVRTEDEAARIEEEISEKRSEVARLQAEYAQARAAEHPYMPLLREHFSRTRAWTLSDLVARIKEEGIDAVRASMPNSTWYKAVRDLTLAGIDVQALRGK